MSELAGRKCIPCTVGTPPLTPAEQEELLAKLGGEWRVVGGHHLEKEVGFPDFRAALAFTNQVGEVAEAAGHHPDVHLSYGKVRITIWTHKIDGLSAADFVRAPKIDQLL
jgi:4a-hydroxytetrahydrobiopterin dehydratase